MLLSVRNLNIGFPARAATLAAVRELSFSIAAGEVMALVGESGSGKSLTALAIMGLLPPQAAASGSIEFEAAAGANGDSPSSPQARGKDAADEKFPHKPETGLNGAPADSSESKPVESATIDLLRLLSEEMRRLRGAQIAMIFQEPMTSLNPVMRVGEQIAEAITAHHKVSRRESHERAVEALREVAIADPERRSRDYPHQLSGGMRQRVMIAMALVNRPRLLIADEPTTALDVNIQKQILELLAGLQQKHKLALLLISHDLGVVANFAQRVAVMYAGSIVESAPARELFAAPLHPYTQGLLRAMPSLRAQRGGALRTIEGTVPALSELPPGCAFEPRCEIRVEDCRRALPPLLEIAPGHAVRCPVSTKK
jgi:oligopeptide/dipeptide ABC transporter ATP-binding protein